MAQTVKAVCEEIRRLYQWDQVPWVIGYSGGKDSSAVLQLVWLALKELPPEKRTKPVHVISTDTLVEQPVVATWVDASHARMRQAAAEQQMPITPHKLTPDVKDTFWVNLIGRGYPAPRKLFRWCTSRMNGRVQLFHDSVIRGPYKKDAREYWLRRVLETQTQLREIGPEEFRSIELITMDELQEIRRLWRFEKHEFDDSVLG